MLLFLFVFYVVQRFQPIFRLPFAKRKNTRYIAPRKF